MSDPVTIDLDMADPLDIYKAWFNLLDLGADSIKGRVSSGGNGVHLKAYGFGTEWPHYKIREMIGDDPMRIEKDRQKPWRPKGVLFDSKGDNQAGGWVDDPFSLVEELTGGMC